jgi:hypothetical protein
MKTSIAKFAVQHLSRAAIAFTVVATGYMASNAQGAAALAGGALTSCKPTATTPALRQIQINADPLNVESYQLTMTFPADLVTIVNTDVDVVGVNGYSAVAQSLTIIGNTGYVTVAGSNAAHPPGELDVFGVKFRLIDGLSLDTPLQFSVFANPVGAPPDYITAFDTDTLNTITYNPSNIAPSFSGPVAIVPEPAALTGLLAIGALARARRQSR